MTAILCTVVAHMFALGVDVDFALVPVTGPGGPTLRYTLTIETTGGKASAPVAFAGQASHTVMRDTVGGSLRVPGLTVVMTTASAFVVTGTEKMGLKSIAMTGETPADTSPSVRFIPKGR